MIQRHLFHFCKRDTVTEDVLEKSVIWIIVLGYDLRQKEKIFHYISFNSLNPQSNVEKKLDLSKDSHISQSLFSLNLKALIALISSKQTTHFSRFLNKKQKLFSTYKKHLRKYIQHVLNQFHLLSQKKCEKCDVV